MSFCHWLKLPQICPQCYYYAQILQHVGHISTLAKGILYRFVFKIMLSFYRYKADKIYQSSQMYSKPAVFMLEI